MGRCVDNYFTNLSFFRFYIVAIIFVLFVSFIVLFRVKAFFTYLEYKEIIQENPFLKLKIKSQEPFLLPRIITMQNLQKIFSAAYNHLDFSSMSTYKQKSCIRDIAVLELLFATGLRVSELCSLQQENMELEEGAIRIYGKGSKERIIQVTNTHVLNALSNYQNSFKEQMLNSPFFFLNRLGNSLSEQSVRFMINRYVDMANISEHVTPICFGTHMSSPRQKIFYCKRPLDKYISKGLLLVYIINKL